MPDLTTLVLLLIICLFLLFRKFSGDKKLGDKNYIELFRTIEHSVFLVFILVLLIVFIIAKIVNE